jgi:hypothetical protein
MSAAVLTGIGGGSLFAVRTQRTIVISVAACPEPGPVIVLVGEEGLVMDMAVMPCVRERRHCDHRQNRSRSKKPDH